MGGLRWLIAGSLLTIYLVARGRPLPPVSQWGGIALLGFLMLGLGNGGVVFAEQFVPSGLAAVIVATAPFWMAAVEALPAGRREAAPIDRRRSRDWLQRDRAARLAGSDARIREQPGFLAGIVGVADRRRSAGRSVRPTRSVTAARPRRVPAPIPTDEVLGNGRLSDARGRTDHDRRRHAPRRVEHALLHHADDRRRCCTCRRSAQLAGSSRTPTRLRHLPVSFVSLYAYINPVIAVALGVLVLHEPFTWRMAIAAALVFAGVAVVRWQRAARHEPGRRTCRCAAPRGRRVRLIDSRGAVRLCVR